MMRHTFGLILLAGSILTNGLYAVQAQTTLNPRAAEQFQRQNPTPLRPRPELTCADPMAQGVNYTLVSRTARFQGRVRITGVVRNQGTAAYQSGANQQIAYLYEQNPGAQPRLVAQRAFQNLNPGQEVQVVFERTWNSSSPSEGEFPPAYIVAIGYDPDIRLDGNLNNDDCRLGNNRLERSGTEINALF